MISSDLKQHFLVKNDDTIWLDEKIRLLHSRMAQLSNADAKGSLVAFDGAKNPDYAQLVSHGAVAQPVVLTGTSKNDRLTGGDLDDYLDGAGGNDRLVGRGGADQLDGGSGKDRVNGGDDDEAIYVLSENTGSRDFYDGGDDTDTLTLVMTRDEWFRADVQADVARFLAHLADTGSDGGHLHGHHSEMFRFSAFDLRVRQFENLKIVVDGDILDPTDQPVLAVDDLYGEPAAPIDENEVFSANVLANDSVPDLLASVRLLATVLAGTLTFEEGAQTGN